jgi:hypothetical protein
MLLVLVAPALAVLLAIFLVLVPPLAALDYVRRKRLRRTFAQKYGQIGKDLVLVYSDSPHWKEYVESRWLVGGQDRVQSHRHRSSSSRPGPRDSVLAGVQGL